MAKLHLIGNAHIDPVWLWRWQEGFAEIRATFRSALDRLSEYPDLKFTSACAVYYQWIEKMDPEMFEEIRQRVQEGRWNIVGGWFLQPDCNIPCGESFARHGLLSQRYFRQKFGVTARIGYNVDSFGHNASLPQILRKSGMDGYVFLRPMPGEKELEGEIFWWESADGSRVCAYRIPESYGFETKDGLQIYRKIKQKADKDGRDYMAFFGVGNHGGGPTIKLINGINQMRIPEAVYSTPEKYFAEVDKADIPVIKDELQHHARGCYSVNTFVKTGNRKCENNLLAAEKLSLLARHLAGTTYPEKKLQKAWKNLLFNQFHDILGGCSIRKAYEDAGYLYGEAMSITEQAINTAMQTIASRIDTLCGETLPAYKRPDNNKLWEHEILGTPVVVFNPHTWEVRMPVEINLKARKITDDLGQSIPFQIVRGDQTNGKDKYHTIFWAQVGALGYRTYRAFLEKEEYSAFDGKLSVNDHVIENDRIRVEFSEHTGDICRFYHKETKQDLLYGECRAILLDETEADTWAHDMDSLGEVDGIFGKPEIALIEDGPVRAVLRIRTYCKNTVLQRDYIMDAESEEILVKVKVDFQEKHKALKITFPDGGEEVTAKIPYGTIRRKKGLGEEPCGSWFASGALCVANDSKYGYDTEGCETRLTVLRGAVYADHFGERDNFCEYIDQGIHEFSYKLFPYTDNVTAERKSQELNFGLRHIIESFHAGNLPEKQSCFSCDAEHIVVTAVKKAEDDEEEIIRFCEMNGKEENAALKLFGKSIHTKVSHNEIKTFRMDGI